MKTSYNNFIDDYWENEILKMNEKQDKSRYENDMFSITKKPYTWVGENTYENLLINLNIIQSGINFKNKFLEIISSKKGIENWVDIENEYYTQLKNTYLNPQFSVYGRKVVELNDDFNQIKLKLVDYLKQIEHEFNENKGANIYELKKAIGNIIYEPFNLKDFTEASKNSKIELEYNLIKKDIEDLKNDPPSVFNELNDYKKTLISKVGIDNPLENLSKFKKNDDAHHYIDLIPDNILFLNFNYTSTHLAYNNPINFDQIYDNKKSKVKSINIHGHLENINNPVIFGFGDELDEEYKQIEKLNNNKYLENIKSINYLETNNYKELLDFISSSSFQVFIFGHSCGLSDRTLLNTIFEHDNCASIKLFYHKKDIDNDNYSDIVRNISRNFNDKAKMRDRVVNKNYCKPLYYNGVERI